MIVLDENIVDGQRLLLEGWNVTARQVGLNVGSKGLKDEEIVVLLRRLRQPTFFTRDLSFYTPELRHQHCAIVVAAVGQYELAAFVRRFLHHLEFDAHANRAGKIMRIASSGIAWWQLRRQQEAFVAWETRVIPSAAKSRKLGGHRHRLNLKPTIRVEGGWSYLSEVAVSIHDVLSKKLLLLAAL